MKPSESLSPRRGAGILAELKAQSQLLLGSVAVLWVVEIIDAAIARPVFGRTLDVYGILPRTPIGLRGILFAPFLHGGFEHLLANTVPFLIMGWLVSARGRADFLWVSAIAALSSGLGTWVFGRPALHIGASGVVFGYFGYLLFRGYFERSAIAVAVTLVTGITYGSLIWGVLPSQGHISWEGHLFGFLGGVLAARL
ncbi:MAG: rhomboid family intramembrane serine protease, partial [Pseudanabaenaceae cyanobacterium]